MQDNQDKSSNKYRLGSLLEDLKVARMMRSDSLSDFIRRYNFVMSLNDETARLTIVNDFVEKTNANTPLTKHEKYKKWVDDGKLF